MTSYHDLEKQVYEEVRAEPYTRIHGRPSWRDKERLIKESKVHALRNKVSYDWSGQYGLLPEIIGAARFALENPMLPAYVTPVQPANSPAIAGNASAVALRHATDANNLLKRDWAVTCGFRRGVGANMRDALDLEFYSALEHDTYEYLNVDPRDYIDHLETNHCPLDVTAINELKAHYYRGNESNERLSKFATRLDQEQTRLAADGIIIPETDKFQHYLSEIYKSGVFSVEAITQWTETPALQQTYANARIFYEAKQRGMENIQRLTAGATGGTGFGTAAAAREIQQLRDIIKESIEETVAAALESKMEGDPEGEKDHALSIRQLRDDHKKEIEELFRAITDLTKQVKELKVLKANTNKADENTHPNSPPKKRKDLLVWKPGLKLDKTWSGKKKFVYYKLWKENDSEGWKKDRAENLRRQLKEVE